MIKDILEELEELQTCFDALSDLLIPDLDLQAIQKDHLAQLVGYLNRRQIALTGRLRGEVLATAQLKSIKSA